MSMRILTAMALVVSLACSAGADEKPKNNVSDRVVLEMQKSRLPEAAMPPLPSSPLPPAPVYYYAPPPPVVGGTVIVR